VGFSGSKWTMLRIVKSMGFRYKRCNDGRKCLMENSDTTAPRIEFVRMNKVKQKFSTDILNIIKHSTHEYKIF
jgi:hypothetical protein